MLEYGAMQNISVRIWYKAEYLMLEYGT